MKIRKWLVGLKPETVRVRLLLAFLVMFLSSMSLALVGWQGMKNTQDALDGFQSDVLPDISRALEMAQKTSSLAAMAPYVAETTLPFQLQTEADALRSRLYEASRLSRGLSRKGVERQQLVESLSRLEKSIEALISATRQDLFLREDLREQLYQLDRLQQLDEFQSAPSAAVQLARQLLIASSVSDIDTLSVLEKDVQQNISSSLLQEGFPQLIALAVSDTSIFSIRKKQFALLDQKAFLLSLTRAEAARLGQEVDVYVGEASKSVENRTWSVKHAVQSGLVGIAVLTGLSILFAISGAGAVNRLVKSLSGITKVMSKLAKGDTEQTVPALTRKDELGELARAFQVFRENALAIRRMANDLTEQRKLLETVFENINDGLSVFDRHGNLLAWNQRYVTLLEFAPGQLAVGTPLHQIQAWLPVVDVSTPLPSWQALNDLRQHSEQRFEFTFPNGKVVEFRSNPMPGGGFVTLYSDLSERRAVEAQLRQSQKMEVLGQLTGGVAHDFNNLLAAILGNLYLLEVQPDLSDEATKYLRRARQASERGGQLTQRLLAFARKQSLKPELLDLNLVVVGLTDLVEYSIGSGVGVELVLSEVEPFAWLDRAQLENAILNLVLNARDAMQRQGQIKIATMVDAASKMVSLSITDSGTGIPEHIRERVFEPFFTTKTGSGSGLGLSIIYGFVKQSGGDIQLSSVMNSGTTFTLYFPLAEKVFVESAQDDLYIAPIPEGLNLLLVEDEEDVRDALTDVLRHHGFQVVPVSSVDSALSSAEIHAFDFVLSDVDLYAGGSGVQLLLALNKLQPDLPVLLMSGLPSEMLKERFDLPMGANLLPKPFKIEMFQEKLVEMLDLA
ncbi:PAS-domain containing protein [Leeia sp. TBRC 13508]|uniref:histidine kinase n=1 Tax=Leeia speluncae TaxID=2884804 RepID=A0ABS8D2V1_9NEIS|nr:PAS-domain containing protein [Leeia speluncae]MCB6182511.1 PAS-domain containing protein [Leeia speluncae]